MTLFINANSTVVCDILYKIIFIACKPYVLHKVGMKLQNYKLSFMSSFIFSRNRRINLYEL